MCACRENSFGGGNTRSSCSTDVMLANLILSIGINVDGVEFKAGARCVNRKRRTRAFDANLTRMERGLPALHWLITLPALESAGASVRIVGFDREDGAGFDFARAISFSFG